MFCCFSIRLFSLILGFKDDAKKANKEPTTNTIPMAKIIVYELLSSKLSLDGTKLPPVNHISRGRRSCFWML